MRFSCEWQLYVIIDRAASGGRELAQLAAAAIRGGADVIQLRDKSASMHRMLEQGQALRTVTRAMRVPLIINDHVEVALASEADGVHLGQEDTSIAQARRVLGQGKLVGKSTHSLEQAIAAEQEGADYLGCGPIFTTPTKPDYDYVGTGLIAQVMAQVRIPVVCIGGIEPSTLPEVLQRGGRCIAVVRAICAAEDPESAARELKTTIQQFHRAPLPRPL